MKSTNRLQYLRAALVVFGLIFIFAIYPFMIFWSSGWTWLPEQPKYEQMIVGVYATLGVFLLIASRNPLKHLSLIWFTVWSSFVHAGIMAIQTLTEPAERGHLYGDIPALLIVAVVFAALTPRGSEVESTGDAISNYSSPKLS